MSHGTMLLTEEEVLAVYTFLDEMSIDTSSLSVFDRLNFRVDDGEKVYTMLMEAQYPADLVCTLYLYFIELGYGHGKETMAADLLPFFQRLFFLMHEERACLPVTLRRQQEPENENLKLRPMSPLQNEDALCALSLLTSDDTSVHVLYNRHIRWRRYRRYLERAQTGGDLIYILCQLRKDFGRTLHYGLRILIDRLSLWIHPIGYRKKVYI
jgi:hypothetical protein